MKFIKKNLSNILFFAFILFLFSPYGVPFKAFLIKGVSFVSTRLMNVEIDASERVKLSTYQWKLTDLNNKDLDFKSLENKVVIVNFWATWCAPCIAEMPSFQKLYNDYQDQVEFLFVTQDDIQKVRNFLEKSNYEFPVYFPRSQRPEEMSSNSLPTTYIIDKNGQIAVDKVGAMDWNSGKIRGLLDELIE